MCGHCLAAYKETGLEPEEIIELKFRMEEKVNKCSLFDVDFAKIIEDTFGISVDRLRELKQADDEGRCVVFPCRIGDAVFAAETSPVIPLKVAHFGMWLDGEDGGDWESIENIGKTVFLTREEAEAALEEMKNG